jgi:hypothetical protein
MIRSTTLIAALCAALVLASCGKDEGSPIPAKRATRLESLLKQVQRQSDAGSCTTLLDQTIPALEQQASALPNSVGSDTRTTIQDGIAHLRGLAETDCNNRQQNELPTTTQSTPSTSTDTTPSTSTDTTPSTSTDTTPSTSTDTTPSTDTNPSTETTPPVTPPGNGGQTPGQGAGGTPPGKKNDPGAKTGGAVTP